MTVWRPRQSIRAIALAAIRRDDDLLVVAVPDDSGAIKGWRFLGGGIEFGERATETLARELKEEIGADIVVGARIGILENVYEHHGVKGHEIVFVYEAVFVDPAMRARDVIEVLDDDVTPRAQWVALDAFRSHRETLFPEGLVDLLK